MNRYGILCRCIRERNCGTGYQVDPTTQTCVGRKYDIEECFRLFLGMLDVDECEQDIHECR